jgi:hypothetical protein
LSGRLHSGTRRFFSTLELRFEDRSRGIRFNFIDGGPYQAQIRSIAIPEHMAFKCDLRVRINLAIVFNPHIAAPLLRLIAKRATELKALIFLEKADRELNVHVQILIQLLVAHTVDSGGQTMCGRAYSTYTDDEIGFHY